MTMNTVQRGLLKTAGLWAMVVGVFWCCTPLKPYEKEYLLEPVMGDDISANLAPNLMLGKAGSKEKLSPNASGGVSGTSCPTCGG